MTDHVKVLVIEDERAIRDLFCAALEGWGYGVDAAASGSAGLELFKTGGYAVVLTDYRMPGLTGVEVAVAMRRQIPTVQVILITGAALDEELDAARQLNFTILRKPVGLADLKAAVDQAAARRGTTARPE